MESKQNVPEVVRAVMTKSREQSKSLCKDNWLIWYNHLLDIIEILDHYELLYMRHKTDSARFIRYLQLRSEIHTLLYAPQQCQALKISLETYFLHRTNNISTDCFKGIPWIMKSMSKEEKEKVKQDQIKLADSCKEILNQINNTKV